jgi:hypothetical protein
LAGKAGRKPPFLRHAHYFRTATSKCMPSGVEKWPP